MKNNRGQTTVFLRTLSFSRVAGFFRAPGMGALLWVKVPPQADHSERSEAQLRKGDRAWEGSVEQNCEPMDKNRIQGAAE